MTGRFTIPEAGSAIPLQRLGRTDMHISRVGFGAWAIGGAGWVAGWGSQDDSASIASIRHAIHRGINWIDTAAVYGLGHSEEIVRQALTGIPIRKVCNFSGSCLWLLGHLRAGRNARFRRLPHVAELHPVGR